MLCGSVPWRSKDGRNGNIPLRISVAFVVERREQSWKQHNLTHFRN